MTTGTGLPEYIIFYADDARRSFSIVKGGKLAANCRSGDWEGRPRRMWAINVTTNGRRHPRVLASWSDSWLAGPRSLCRSASACCSFCEILALLCPMLPSTSARSAITMTPQFCRPYSSVIPPETELQPKFSKSRLFNNRYALFKLNVR